MNRNILFQLLLLCSTVVFSQNSQADDIQTPELSPFSMGQGSIQGAIANSVKEVTGKVSFSVPIANIGSRGGSYPVA